MYNTGFTHVCTGVGTCSTEFECRFTSVKPLAPDLNVHSDMQGT